MQKLNLPAFLLVGFLALLGPMFVQQREQCQRGCVSVNCEGNALPVRCGDAGSEPLQCTAVLHMQLPPAL